MAHPGQNSTVYSQPQFELYQQTPKEALRHFLVTVTERCRQGWHFLPRRELKEKFTHYKAAVAHPEVAAKVSFKQERAIKQHAANRASPPDTSRIRQRPKRARDAFGPGMVLVVNTVLVWLMFSIDVRNAMLR